MPVPAPAIIHSSPIQLVPVPKYWLKLPMTLFTPELPLVPKERVKPYSTHRTEMSPILEKLIIIMFRAPLDRLRPP
nr:hypothetical protein GCM10020092_017610 [Actinoplanes digitatis]